MGEAVGNQPNASLRLSVLDERLAVSRLDPDSAIPAWATSTSLFSVTRSHDELSVVCPEDCVPDDVKREDGWRALKLEGTFDFEQVGVLASLAVPLAEAGVAIFAISTHDTDYILVKQHQLDAAITALSDRGYEVRTDGPVEDGTFTLRPATGEDEGFLWEMLAEAAHETSVRAVAANSGTARYVEGWGRDGDLGFLATSPDGEPLGAAWLRMLRGENAGYGYVDDETPELAIAVLPEVRGDGVGERMLTRLLEAAEHLYRAVSLSVRSDNPALRLYQRVGFREVEGSGRANRVDGTSITMKLDLKRNDASRAPR